MELGDLVVVFNATPERQEQRIASLAGTAYTLHPVQRTGADSTVKSSAYDPESGSFAVPGRSVAVFTRTA